MIITQRKFAIEVVTQFDCLDCRAVSTPLDPTLKLSSTSVYLGESPRVKIAAARDVPLIITELESILPSTYKLMARCAHSCRWDSDCREARCPHCIFNPGNSRRLCRQPRANMENDVDF